MNDQIEQGGYVQPKHDQSLVKTTTYDTVQKLHEISEERLNELIGMNGKASWDLSLVCLALCVGLIQNFWKAVAALLNPAIQGNLLDFFLTSIFLVCFGIGVSCFFHWLKSNKDLKESLGQLKSRETKTTVYKVAE